MHRACSSIWKNCTPSRRGSANCLRDDGVFVVQFLYMKSILENLAFDQIYHEHLLYYNLNTIEQLARRHGLALFDAYLSPIHGGSIIGFVGTSEIRRPADHAASGITEGGGRAEKQRTGDLPGLCSPRVEGKKRKILAVLPGRRRGKRIYGFGAPVKGNTLLNYFGIGTHISIA